MKPTTDEIYLKGGTIYVGIKEAKLLNFDIVSITKGATAAVAPNAAKPTVPANTPAVAGGAGAVAAKTYLPTDDEQFLGKAVVTFTSKIFTGSAPNPNVVAAQLMGAVKKLVPDKKFALFKAADSDDEVEDNTLTGGGIVYIGIEK